MTTVQPIGADQVTTFAELIGNAGDAPSKVDCLSDPDPNFYLYLGAFVDEVLVGVLEGGITGRDFTDDGGLAATYPPPHAYASLMYVLADHRRTGIGTALLAAFAGRAAQAHCSFIKLLVDESDGDSAGRRALFAAAGFTPCGKDPAVNMGAAVDLVRTRTRPFSGTTRRTPSPDEVLAARSPAGGWDHQTLAARGLPWPPPEGMARRARREVAIRAAPDRARLTAQQHRHRRSTRLGAAVGLAVRRHHGPRQRTATTDLPAVVLGL